jgi:hypothetical protein
MVTLQFKHGEPLQVHEELLFRERKMRVLIPPATKSQEVFRQFISRISRSAGHILVQFLYTGQYKPLGWKGPTDDDTVKAASLHTAIEVYATARLFMLWWLEHLAKQEITRLAKGVDLFTIIDIVKETYPDVSGNDIWFPTFIKSTMKAALEKPRVPATAATSLDKMLLWGAMEVFRDKLDALTAMTTSAAEEQVSDATAAPRKMEKAKEDTVEVLEAVEAAVLESELPVKSLSAEVEPVAFPVEEPLVEQDPLPEPGPKGDTWAIPAKEEPFVRENPLPEPEAEVVEEVFASTSKKKYKKKKAKCLAEDKPLAPIDVSASSPITESWVVAESSAF